MTSADSGDVDGERLGRQAAGKSKPVLSPVDIRVVASKPVEAEDDRELHLYDMETDSLSMRMDAERDVEIVRHSTRGERSSVNGRDGYRVRRAKERK